MAKSNLAGNSNDDLGNVETDSVDTYRHLTSQGREVTWTGDGEAPEATGLDYTGQDPFEAGKSREERDAAEAKRREDERLTEQDGSKAFDQQANRVNSQVGEDHREAPDADRQPKQQEPKAEPETAAKSTGVGAGPAASQSKTSRGGNSKR